MASYRILDTEFSGDFSIFSNPPGSYWDPRTVCPEWEFIIFEVSPFSPNLLISVYSNNWKLQCEKPQVKIM